MRARDLIGFAMGLLVGCLIDACDARYRYARTEWNSLRARITAP